MTTQIELIQRAIRETTDEDTKQLFVEWEKKILGNMQMLLCDFQILEVGKRYRTRDTRAMVTIVEKLDQNVPMFRGDNGEDYFDDGRKEYYGRMEPKDLVLEVWGEKGEQECAIVEALVKMQQVYHETVLANICPKCQKVELSPGENHETDP